MPLPKMFDGLNRNERLALMASAALIVLCFLVINFYQFNGSDDSDSKHLGYISEISNDIRHKTNGKVFWHNANVNQSIGAGDKVFTGKKSSAKITLKNKSSFELSESSLVEFKDLNKEKVPDFTMGNFTLSVKGTIHILIGGKVAEIHGDNSEVHLKIDKKKNVSFEVLKGATEVSYKSKVFSLNEKRTVADYVNTEAPVIAEAITVRTPSAPPMHFEHATGLYDVYEKNGSTVAHKMQSMSLVNQKITLGIDGLLPSDSVYIEHADNPAFSEAIRLHVGAANVYLAQAYLGQNFWRYSPDQKRWSVTMNFDVTSSLIANSKPSVVSKPEVPLLSGQAKAPFEVSAPVDITGYIVEYSSEPDFHHEESRLFWFYHDKMTLLFDRAGKYYTRFRAVDRELHLGEWSDTREVSVFAVPDLAAPRLVQASHESQVDDVIDLKWRKQKLAQVYKITLLDATKSVMQKFTTDKAIWHWTPHREGTYFVEVRYVDEYGRNSLPLLWSTLKVSAPPPVHLADRHLPARSLTSTDLTSAMQLADRAANKIYIQSMASLASAYYTFLSAAQNGHVDPAVSPGLIADFLIWLNNHGLEAIVQKNIASSGTATTASVDILSAEARYRYRITPTDMTLFRAFQTSVFAGYELYRNSDKTFFAEKYNLFKLGLILDVPVFDNWLLGSQVAYGSGSDAQKMEASMNLDYFFKRNWSMGAGYKLNLISIDNPKQFPTFTSYREGYTNGVFNVKYFF